MVTSISRNSVGSNLGYLTGSATSHPHPEPMQRCKRVPLLAQASIRGSATLCVSRWTQRRGRQLHRVQYRREHRARLLTEKALRCRCPIRPGEEKVVNGGEALALARQIESSKVMTAQGQVTISPLDIGA